MNPIYVLFLINIFNFSHAFEHPPVTIKVYFPKGFTVSIPSLPDITLFAFHGKLNEEFNGLEAGKWSRDITKSQNGSFTFVEHDTALKIGDEIHFWTYTLHNGLGYRHDNGLFIVKNYETEPIDVHFSSKYEIPLPDIRVFNPKGFQVSIPEKYGITVFAFHGKVNEKLDGLEAGKWSKDITKAVNGSFTFRDNEFELKIGDKLYYWLFVIKDGLGYRRDNGIYEVVDIEPR